jgi:hypothetical protein
MWQEYERAWLRKHASARRFERIFKTDTPDDDADDERGDNGDADQDSNNKGTATMGTFPIHKVAKNIVETGVSWLTEQQLTEKIFEHAQRDRRGGETPEQAFARCFSADDEHGRTFRKAVQNARTGTYHPFPR